MLHDSPYFQYISMLNVIVNEIITSEPDSMYIQEASIDLPVIGRQSLPHSIVIAGWVLAKDVPVEELYILYKHRILEKTTLTIHREDVRACNSKLTIEGPIGFYTKVNLIGIPSKATIRLEALLKDGTRVQLSSLSLEKELLKADSPSTPHPLSVCGLGRSGTTFLMKILHRHPEIVVQGTYPYEFRACAYWIHQLKVLSSPALSPKEYPPGNFWHNHKMVGPMPFFQGNTVNDPEINEWFSSGFLPKLAEFSLNSAKSVYRHIGLGQGKEKLMYFAEKLYPNHIPHLIKEIDPKAKEIFLVRDFRDMVASMLAFDQARQSSGFGRVNFKSDEAFIQFLSENHVMHMLDAWNDRSESALLVKYEDLISSPQKEVRKILTYLGLPYDNNIVEVLLNSSENADKNNHVTSKSIESSIGRWKESLSPDLQRLSNKVFSSALKSFGYTAS